MAFVIYGTETDGPYVREVPDDTAETVAAEVHGTSHATLDAALSAWRDRDAPTVETDAQAPQGDAPGAELGADPTTPDGATEPPTLGTETPTESSPSADQR